ncbi:MAG: hypothetical protein AB7D06_17985 [Pedobacter sp.]
MEFSNIVKGQVTQTLVKTLFEESGYRVERLGIEELIRDVKKLDKESYKALSLPNSLRKIPDLFITDACMDNAWLVEVKYRRRLDKRNTQSLCKVLQNQYAFWPDTYVILINGDSIDEKKHQDIIRVVTPSSFEKMPNQLKYKRPSFYWYSEPLHKVFSEFEWRNSNGHKNSINADSIAVSVVKYLTSLDEVSSF